MKRLIAVICLFLASVSVSVAQQDRLRIVTTTADLRSLAKAVGAERVNRFEPCSASGETPEEYQPKLQDVEILKDAKIVVRAAPGDRSLVRQIARARGRQAQPAAASRAASPAISTPRRRSRPTIRSASAPASRARGARRAAGPIRITGSIRKARTRSPRKWWRSFRKPIRKTRNITRQPQDISGAARRQDQRMAVASAAAARRADDRIPRRLELFRQPLPPQYRGLHGRARPRAAQAREDRGTDQADQRRKASS